MIKSYHHSSRSEEYITPEWLFHALDQEFGFTLDAAATSENAKCKKYFDKKTDGLYSPWEDNIVFCNPPYGKRRGMDLWVKKGYAASLNGATVVMLLPVRADCFWWHEYAMKGEIRLFKHRLRFNDQGPAPFGSAIVVFRPAAYKMVSYEQATCNLPIGNHTCTRNPGHRDSCI